MRSVAIVASLLLSMSAAFAQGCSPPAGMGIQQWYAICGGALQQAYAAGMGQGYSYDAFVQSMYQVYARPVPGPVPGGMACNIGETQCFSGYVRQCQPMPTGGSWWITGSQQCQ